MKEVTPMCNDMNEIQCEFWTIISSKDLFFDSIKFMKCFVVLIEILKTFCMAISNFVPTDWQMLMLKAIC